MENIRKWQIAQQARPSRETDYYIIFLTPCTWVKDCPAGNAVQSYPQNHCPIVCACRQPVAHPFGVPTAVPGPGERRQSPVLVSGRRGRGGGVLHPRDRSNAGDMRLILQSRGACERDHIVNRFFCIISAPYTIRFGCFSLAFSVSDGNVQRSCLVAELAAVLEVLFLKLHHSLYLCLLFWSVPGYLQAVLLLTVLRVWAPRSRHQCTLDALLPTLPYAIPR